MIIDRQPPQSTGDGDFLIGTRQPTGMIADGTPVQTVGIVGDGDTVTASFDRAGVESTSGPAAEVVAADPDVLVGVGEAALLDLAREQPAAPLVPVDAGRGLRSVPLDAIGEAADHLAAGTWRTERHPLLSVDATAGDDELALLDAMVVTQEPAHISEFSVFASGDRVARVRADGVVVATPAGTPEYARRVGAPVIPPEPEVVAVVPVAPFSTDLDDWVVPLGEVEIAVEREGAAIETLVDDRTVGPLPVDRPVCLSVGGHVDVVRVAASQSPFRQ